MSRRACAIACGLLVWMCGEAAVTEAALRFTEVAKSTGVHCIHDALGIPIVGTLQGHAAPGAAWSDLNNDGWLDLIVSNGGNDGIRIFLNDGDGSFSEVSEQMAVTGRSASTAALSVDVDNDGFSDLFFAHYFVGPSLFHARQFEMVERGSGFGLRPLLYGDFEEPPPGFSGPVSMGAAFGDYDRDGFLDVYIANHVIQPDVLARNISGGYFLRTDLVEVPENQHSFQPVFLDFDSDGNPDIFVVNDWGVDFFFRNSGPEGGYAMVEMGDHLKIGGGHSEAEPRSMGMGCAVGDYDNDLDPDVYVTNFRAHALWENIAVGDRRYFRDRAAEAGVDYIYNGWGAAFFDADLDGDLDLFVINGWVNGGPDIQSRELENKLYRNDGAPDWTFTDITDQMGMGHVGLGRALAVGDYDRDGDPDLFVTNNTFYDPFPGPNANVTVGESLLYRNDQDDGLAWLIVRLQGGGDHGNGFGCSRDAVGARAYVSAGGVTQMREVRAGGSFESMHSLELEFGLGTASSIDELRVQWLCGAEEIFSDVEPRSYYRLVEASGAATPFPIVITSFEVTADDDGVELQWITAPSHRIETVTVYRGLASDPTELEELDLTVQFDAAGGFALDDTAEAGTSYVYRLSLRGAHGVTTTSMAMEVTALDRRPPVTRARVRQNFPNPFNPGTTILFDLPRTQRVRLALYDAAGRVVRVLVDDVVEAGESREAFWDGRDDRGRRVASGVYTYVLRSDEGSSSRALTLIR